MKRLTKKNKMLLAFTRAITELERSVAPDVLKFCDYDYQLEQLINQTLEDVQHNEYRPKKAESYDLPKGEFAIRPGMIINLLDLTVLHYLIAEFIMKLDSKLPAGVTAYRIRRDKKVLFSIKRDASYMVLPKYKRNKLRIEEPWYNLWPEFKENLKKDLLSGKYKYVACTDITAYFEDIDLNTLSEILKKKDGKYAQNINLIIEIYKSWALRDPVNIRQSRGLPQSIKLSGILSNYYLDSVDSYLEKEKNRSKRIKWYRYCDDINILCTNRARAKFLLLQIGSLLRNLGLNQNAQKTKILTASEALKELFNDSTEKISKIIKKSQKKGARKSVLISKLSAEYKKVSRRRIYDKNDEATLMRAYTAATVLDSPMLTNRVIEDFKRFPVRAPSLSKYARRFINYKKVHSGFRVLLHKSNRYLLYYYQLSYLVSVFRNLKRFNKDIYLSTLDLLHDDQWHWQVRTQSVSTLFYIAEFFSEFDLKPVA